MTNTMNVKRSDIPMQVAEELYAEQIVLERMMREEGQNRYFKTLKENIKSGRGDKTSFGSIIIGENIEVLSHAIAEEMVVKTKGNRKVPSWVLMSELKPKSLAMITLQIITTKILERTPFASLCVNIGKAVEDEIRMGGIRQQDDRAYATLLKGNKFRTSQNNKRLATIRINREIGAHIEWNEATRMRCGIVLFQMFQVSLPNKFDIVVLAETKRRKHTTTKYVIPTQDTIDWMRKHVATAQFMRPMYQPMVVPPIQWCNTRVVGGGYVTNYINPLKLVKVRQKAKLDVYSQTKMPAVFDAINAAQETAWTVNNKILEVILEACKRKHTLGSMPTLEELHIPELPEGYTQQELTEFKRMKRDNIAENVQRRGKAASFHIIVSQADTYKDYEKIYIPYQLDFRGRLYSIPMLNPQGADFTKALLHFADAKAIGSEEALCYMFIHVANLFGIDKVSFDERIAWTQEHLSELAMCATDPYNNKLWEEADKPFQALAACYEVMGYLVNGLEHKTRMSVSLDGSCSGLQNLGMALACEVTGKSVNLIPSDKPNDIYKNVADEVTEELKLICQFDKIESLTLTLLDVKLAALRDLNLGYLSLDSIINSISKPKDKLTKQEKEYLKVYNAPQLAYEWLKFGITRKVTKRPVMTYPYGSKKFGFKCQIQEDTLLEVFKDKATSPFTLTISETAAFLAHYVFEAVERTVLKAAEAMNWLQSCANVLATEGKPIMWYTPLGFHVTQDYRQTKLKLVSTEVNGQRFQLGISEAQLALDVRKNANSISPNYVHSLDSSHLMLTVALAANEGIKDFALIHDSFGTHVADTSRLFAIIREAFLELYSADDVLNSLYLQFREQAKNPDDITLPPRKGNLKRSLILDSLYAFA